MNQNQQYNLNNNINTQQKLLFFADILLNSTTNPEVMKPLGLNEYYFIVACILKIAHPITRPLHQAADMGLEEHLNV